jgi:hypothetical protein
MAQICKGICTRQKISMYSDTVRFRYRLGQKYCSNCALFVFTEEFTCNCCKTKLRSKARSKRHDL